MDDTGHDSGERAVFSSDDLALIDTCSLVLSSKRVSHRILRPPHGAASILVPKDQEKEAARQLRAYFRENRNWPPALIDSRLEPLATGLPAILLMAAMSAFYLVTGPFNPDVIWFAGGAGDSEAILIGGEYHRLVTALCLHADFSHLASNALIGGFLLYFFLQIGGTGIGLLTLLGGAAVGNYLNCLVHGPGHLSVGFSTAVFAMIGLMAAHQVLERTRMGLVRMLVPFMAGAGLLAMLGSSGVRTDLGAHLFGLLAGFVLGFPAALAPLRRLRESTFAQTCCLLASIFIILICWNLALAA